MGWLRDWLARLGVRTPAGRDTVAAAVLALLGLARPAVALATAISVGAAVIEERGRIARELHDIAAHDLSAIVVQAGAADRQVDHDATAAKATLA